MWQNYNIKRRLSAWDGQLHGKLAREAGADAALRRLDERTHTRSNQQATQQQKQDFDAKG